MERKIPAKQDFRILLMSLYIHKIGENVHYSPLASGRLQKPQMHLSVRDWSPFG